MQHNPLFMMINPNGYEYSSRSNFSRKPRFIDGESTQDSVSHRLENSPKDGQAGKQKRGKDSGHRAGDWICNLCHNHNYSFREICNSCKTQTKIDNLTQSLSKILTETEIARPDPSRQQPKKRLQLKSGEQFERSMKAGLKVKSAQPSNVTSCQEISSTVSSSAPLGHGLFHVFEDSFNEFPFEKALRGSNSEKETDDGLADDDSVELDKETLQILSFD